MTLTTTSNVDRYAAAENQTVFSYTFRVDDSSHMEVSVDGVVQGSGYTVSSVGNDNGGNVTFTTAPRISGAAAVIVALRRLVPLTQSTNLPTQGALDTDALEAEVDRNVMRTQQLNEVDSRTLKLPVESTLTDVGPTDLVGNGGKFLAVNAGETAVVWGTPAATGAVISTFMETVLDDVDAAAARVTLGVVVGATSAKTAAFTVTTSDDLATILCSAASADYAVTLPAAAVATDGFTVTIKKTDATIYMITVTPNGSETIDDLPNLKLRHQHSTVTLVSDGSNWHIQSHENMEIEYDAVQNGNMIVDQYDHVTDIGRQSTQHMIDRWQIVQSGSASAVWTISKEGAGGVDGKSKWLKCLCTTADASPGAGEGHNIQQNATGNTLVGAGFLGSDGLFENAVASLDIIVHADGASSITFPASVALTVQTQDGSSRQYVSDVTVDAADTWQRVCLVLPEDTLADIDPGVTASIQLKISLYGGSGQQSTADSWVTGAGTFVTASTDNLADAINNYIGITNVKFQPGQIATPFVPRPYEEELDICQWYAEKIGPLASMNFANGQCVTTSSTHCILGFKEKRATPTISNSADSDFRLLTAGGSDNEVTSISFALPTKWSVDVNAAGAATLVAGNATTLRDDGGGNAYIFVSAEI